MDVVYFFNEISAAQGVAQGAAHGVRVPFGYGKSLFTLLLRSGGYWDSTRREFIFGRDVNSGQLSAALSGVPCVWVDENFPDQLRVSGFWERPWENAPNASITKKEAGDQPFSYPRKITLPEKLSGHWLNKLDAELRSRKYSIRTQKIYIYYNRLICRTLQKTPEEITPDDVTEFIANMEKSRDYSASSMNLAISAVKFFFRNVLKNDSISEHHRPRHDERLPMVLSKEEIKKVLGMEKNPKHRLLLMLVYSSGLRVSEVVALKREHIDLSRKVIYIRLGKGRKDRSTLLSDKAACFIEEYCEFSGIVKWLFPGQPAERHLTIRSAQNIFDKAVRRAGITKKITIHGLRHTFATHLLESGTDIRYIQTLLGHASLRTTERYTHIAKRSVLNIKSPLDSII